MYNEVIDLEKFDFSNAEYQRFISVCPFSDEELKILDMRRKGKSIIQISLELSMSDRTVSRRIDSIVKKINREI